MGACVGRAARPPERPGRAHTTTTHLQVAALNSAVGREQTPPPPGRATNPDCGEGSQRSPFGPSGGAVDALLDLGVVKRSEAEELLRLLGRVAAMLTKLAK